MLVRRVRGSKGAVLLTLWLACGRRGSTHTLACAAKLLARRNSEAILDKRCTSRAGAVISVIWLTRRSFYSACEALRPGMSKLYLTDHARCVTLVSQQWRVEMAYDFLAVADIWKDYFSGAISMQKRDRLLHPYREALRAAR